MSHSINSMGQAMGNSPALAAGKPLVRPRFVSAVSAVFSIVGTLSVAFSASAFAYFLMMGLDEKFLAIPSLLVSLVYLAIGRGLWRLHPWSRKLLIVISWIGVFGFPVGTLVFSGFLVYFRRKSVKALFSARRKENIEIKHAFEESDLKAGRLVLTLEFLGILVGVVGILSIVIIVMQNGI